MKISNKSEAKENKPVDEVSSAMRQFSKPDKRPSKQHQGFKDEAPSASKVSRPELSRAATSINSKFPSTESLRA